MPSYSTIRRALIHLGAKAYVVRRELLLTADQMDHRRIFCRYELTQLWTALQEQLSALMKEEDDATSGKSDDEAEKIKLTFEERYEKIFYSYLRTLSWSDEKYFTSDFGQHWAYVLEGEAKPRIALGGRFATKKMCWMLIHGEGVFGPYWVTDGTMNTAVCTEMLAKYLPLEKNASELLGRLRFQQDNASCHKLDLLESALTKVRASFAHYLRVHPPASPDLNIIENFWAWMDRRKDTICRSFDAEDLMGEVTKIAKPSLKKEDAAEEETEEQAIARQKRQELWEKDQKIVLANLKALVLSYPRRLLACIDASGKRFVTPKWSWSQTAREIEKRIELIKEEHPLGISEKDCYRSDRGMSKEETARWDKEVIAHLEDKKKKCADLHITFSDRDEKRLSSLLQTVKNREKKAATERQRSLKRYLREEQLTMQAYYAEKCARKSAPESPKKSSKAKNK